MTTRRDALKTLAALAGVCAVPRVVEAVAPAAPKQTHAPTLSSAASSASLNRWWRKVQAPVQEAYAQRDEPSPWHAVPRNYAVIPAHLRHKRAW